MASRVARVLIVEDSVLMAMAIEAALADRGIEAVVAGSLAAARERLARHSIAAALVDLHLPDGDALTLARQLHGRGCPVAICTGSDIGARVDLGPFKCFSKPVSADVLAAWAAAAITGQT